MNSFIYKNRDKEAKRRTNPSTIVTPASLNTAYTNSSNLGNSTPGGQASSKVVSQVKTTGAKIDFGQTTSTVTTGAVSVTFGTKFTSTPRVLINPLSGVVESVVVTATGFTGTLNDNPAGDPEATSTKIDWFAIGA